MFPSSSDGRKYQCFVCGVMFSDIIQMTEHITENHEEGREYITCLACGCCVRDLRLHYRVKHPNRPMPKNCQYTVAVWNDFSPAGKKKRKKPVFKQGNYVSDKMGGKVLFYRSGYELDVYKCLEEDKECKVYDNEPFKINYYYNGEWHHYTPDILVEWTNGKKEIWEVKPASQTQMERNKAKWTAMDNQAKSVGLEFVVITERGIGKLKAKVRNQKLND